MKGNEERSIIDDIIEVEGYCFSCGGSGTTRILPIDIPLYRSVLVSSFMCEHCGYNDRFIQSIEPPAEYGIHYELKIKNPKDLNRLVVRHQHATIVIPEIEFESPPNSEYGNVLTVECFIVKFIDSFEANQEYRKVNEPEMYEKIAQFIKKLSALSNGTQNFTFIVDDPSGNSFVENPLYPSEDPNLWTLKYKRTWAEDKFLNVVTKEEEQEFAINNNVPKEPLQDNETLNQPDNNKEDDSEEMYTLRGTCNYCKSTLEYRMQKVEIPYFKEVLLSSSICDSCGHRNCTVNCLTTFADNGVRFTLKVTNPNDLKRDIVKSEYCTITIPEFEFVFGVDSFPGSYGSLEGFLLKARAEIENLKPLASGDSSTDETKQKFENLLKNMNSLINGSIKFTVIVDDPTGNSYVQNLMAPDVDEYLTEEHYKRSKEQDEYFCLEHKE